MHKVSPDLQWRFSIQLDNVLQWPRLVTACVRIQCEQRKYLIVSLIFVELQNTICKICKIQFVHRMQVTMQKAKGLFYVTLRQLKDNPGSTRTTIELSNTKVL